MTTNLASTTATQSVLVVDDQEHNLQVVGTVLSMMGYDVTPAISGEQALKRIAARRPDLILLDVVMPDMDGLSVCREILANRDWKDIPIIFLSASDDKDLIVEALEAGGVDYVTKPFNKAELLSRVRTHLALKDARDRLRALAEDKDELLGILAHDLKNHLAGMRLSAGLLAERGTEFPARSRTLIENIVLSTDRMMTFVREFLANQSAERLVLSIRDLSFTSEIEAAVARHLDAAATKQITLRMDTSGTTPGIRADAEALAQILDNLLSNAIKFSPPDSTVAIRLPEPSGAYASCMVGDEGPGFTDEDRTKLFHRYGRLSARPTAGEPSSGLGLSIVKRLVESMDGHVNLEESGGRGAIFRIRLPLIPR